MTTRLDELVPLEAGDGHPFAAWPGKPALVPHVARGAYTLWKGDQLLFVGLAGLGDLPEKKPKKPWGLHRRLAAHASGRRAHDQVNCYIADRFVLDTLNDDDLDAIVAGERTMDHFVKAWIDEHLSYRFIEVTTTAVARDLEQRVRRGELNAGPPFLNPLRSQSLTPPPPAAPAPPPPPPPEAPAPAAPAAGVAEAEVEAEAAPAPPPATEAQGDAETAASPPPVEPPAAPLAD